MLRALDRDYTITADITVPEGGAEGMIVTLGGRFGGYGLYLLQGKPVFDYNFLDLKQTRWEGGVTGEDLFTRPLAPGKHTSFSTSNMTDPASPRAERACFRSTATNCRRKPSSIQFRS